MYVCLVVLKEPDFAYIIFIKLTLNPLNIGVKIMNETLPTALFQGVFFEKFLAITH